MGALTVRLPRAQDPHAALFDEDLPEHAILLWDWTHTPAASKFLAHHHAGDDNKADAVLINGKGTTRRFEADDGTLVTAPREVFNVQKVGSRLKGCGFEPPLEGGALLDYFRLGGRILTRVSRAFCYRDSATDSAWLTPASSTAPLSYPWTTTPCW